VIAAAQEALFTGRGVTRVVMLVDVATLLVNAVLDYIWIFGKCGFPEMGIQGAALATVASGWLRVGVYGWLMHREPIRRAYSLATAWRVDRPLLGRILTYGGPNGFQFLVDAAGFALMVMLVGRLGKREMAATALAFNVNTVAFIPMLGVGVAASTLVGQQLMRGRPELAARATWTALSFALVYTATCSVFFVLTPDWLLLGHRAGADPQEFGQLRDVAVVLLRFVAAYCVFDAMQIIFAGAIKGAGDTWFVLFVTMLVSAIGVAVCWLGLSRGLFWWWFVVTGWICALGIIFGVRFLRGRWREMRVIEQGPSGTDRDAAAIVRG
jgi:MATE family multidrug resistance protein